MINGTKKEDGEVDEERTGWQRKKKIIKNRKIVLLGAFFKESERRIKALLSNRTTQDDNGDKAGEMRAITEKWCCFFCRS